MVGMLFVSIYIMLGTTVSGDLGEKNPQHEACCEKIASDELLWFAAEGGLLVHEEHRYPFLTSVDILHADIYFPVRIDSDTGCFAEKARFDPLLSFMSLKAPDPISTSHIGTFRDKIFSPCYSIDEHHPEK